MRFSPPPTRQPTVLTDDMARSIIINSGPIIMNDGLFPMPGKIIGWQRMDAGTLAAIVVNPLTDKRVLYWIDFRTGARRPFGPPKPPKSY